VDNNYLDLGMRKSGFIHTLPSGRAYRQYRFNAALPYIDHIIYENTLSTFCQRATMRSMETSMHARINNEVYLKLTGSPNT
jgi:hypothetical protein